jgi:ribosomal protein S27AE
MRRSRYQMAMGDRTKAVNFRKRGKKSKETYFATYNTKEKNFLKHQFKMETNAIKYECTKCGNQVKMAEEEVKNIYCVKCLMKGIMSKLEVKN